LAQAILAPARRPARPFGGGRGAAMQRSASDAQLLQTRRHVIGECIGGAIPGYAGHVPGQRIEAAHVAGTFARSVEVGRSLRSRPTFDAQALRLAREDEDRRARSAAPAARAPLHGDHSWGYSAAGDVRSRVPASGEEKAVAHSSMGLTSAAYENLGGARQRGFGSVARGIPGFAGHVPGKAGENVFAETWSKCNERSLARHLAARGEAPRSWSLSTEGRTLVAPGPAEMLAEVPIKNPSYQDTASGWSTCDFTGAHVEAAGRMAPRDRQEAFGGRPPKLSTSGPIHGYAGWVPGRMGENVIGERQSKTNAVSGHLFRKNCMRNTQR